MKELLHFLDGLTVPRPEIWGWYHILCVALALLAAGVFYWDKRRGGRISPRAVFGVYGFVAFALELTKQLMWAVVKTENGLVWSYSWYSAPFQYCTMPLYISLILFFSKNKKLNAWLLSFMGLFSIISMVAVALSPGDVFTQNPIINVHTMYLHMGALAVDLFVLIRGLTPLTFKAVLRGFTVFLICTAAALALNIGVQLSGINGGATFNMFYISPYFESTLPVFSTLWHKLPYLLFLLIYIAAFFIGGNLVCCIARLIKGKTPEAVPYPAE